MLSAHEGTSMRQWRWGGGREGKEFLKELLSYVSFLLQIEV